MLTKFNRIKGYRIFQDFNWPEKLPEFSRYNVIYGMNGSGKTSLSSLLHQLQKKEALTAGNVVISLGGQSITSQSFPAFDDATIRVFNRDTVNRSVFEVADGTLPPIYYFGEATASLQQHLAKVEEKRRELTTRLKQQESLLSQKNQAFNTFKTDQARSIRNLLAVGGEAVYLNYDARKFSAMADALSSENYVLLNEDEEAKHLINKAASAKNLLPVLPEVPLNIDVLRDRVQQLLNTKIVAQVIPALEKNNELANWVQQGLTLHQHAQDNATCLYCDQPIPFDRLSALEDHFNHALIQFSSEVSELISQINQTVDTIRQTFPPDPGLLHQFLEADYRSKHADYLESKSKAISGLESCIILLQQKLRNPFSSFNFFEPGNQPTTFLEAAFTLLAIGIRAQQDSQLVQFNIANQALDQLIEKHNSHCESFAKEQQESRKLLERHEVTKALAQYRDYVTTISQIENDAAETNEELTQTAKNIDEIKESLLGHSTVAKELESEVASFLGRDELRFKAEEAGFRITRDGLPAMNLSEGERTAIALVYFLKSLRENDIKLADTIVVIDDPVSSLDDSALFNAFSFIKCNVVDARQLFIFTHNFSLLRQINDWFSYLNKPKKPPLAGSYMLQATVVNSKRNAELRVLDSLLKDYQSEYHYLFDMVLSNSETTGQHELAAYYHLPNVARRLLEAFLAFKIPAQSGEFTNKIRSIPFDEHKKTRILRFLHTFSHHDPIAENQHIGPVLSETPQVLKDVLDFIAHLDKSHFEAMIKLCENKTVQTKN